MVAPTALTLLYPSLFAALMQANYTLFPDEDGALHLIKLDATPLTAEELIILAANLNSITFKLYTRSNPSNGQVLALNDLASVTRSHWKANRPTIFVTHGWSSAGNKSSCTLIRDAYLKVMDCNVIIVDWSSIAKTFAYPTVAKSVPSVAERVAAFVNFLRVSANLNNANTKLIGHSLGAHVASLAAKIVGRAGLVSEVIALDPAKPWFENNDANGRVDRSHAKNVQVIHTNAGKLGMKTAVGTSDFFANGGSKQPGCSIDISGSCAHRRSYEYYSESITHPKGFPGDLMNGGHRAYMGGSTLDPSARGSYNFKTASHPPYALGG